MNLETRKIKFVQSFLSLENESDVALLEQTLEDVFNLRNEKINPLTIDELNSRIDQSEADFENGRFKSHSEIVAKYNGEI